jgi:hypothetical protein
MTTQTRARASPIHGKAIAINGGTRYSLNGRHHLVVPAIGIVEGVLNGELVLRQDFACHVESWNGRPVTLRHPDDDGKPVSANSPDIIERFQIGTMFNAHLVGDRLRAELWIDAQKARTLGKDGVTLLERLENGTPTEVSTGYFRDLDPTLGDWDGVPYAGIARNIKPDHIAILPDQVGACSLNDGCGTPRSNQLGANMKEQRGFPTRIKALFDRVRNNNDKVEALDVLEEAITQAYNDDPHQAHDEAIAGLNSDPTALDTTSEPTLPSTARLTALIQNDATAFDESDRDWLTDLDDAALSKLESTATEDETSISLPKPPATQLANSNEPSSQRSQDKSLDVDAILDRLGVIASPEAANLIQRAVSNERAYRNNLIHRITTNSNLTLDELQVLSDDTIGKLAAATEPNDYSGLGTPALRESRNDNTVPEAPSVVLSENN